jgi:hypothetical protein
MRPFPLSDVGWLNRHDTGTRSPALRPVSECPAPFVPPTRAALARAAADTHRPARHPHAPPHSSAIPPFLARKSKFGAE